MFENLASVGLVILLVGGSTTSMIVPTNDPSAINTTAAKNDENNIGPTDLAVNSVLQEIKNRIFRPDDTHLMSLIKRGVVESAKSRPKSPIEAGAKKAQRYVTDVTSAYTQAIFRATSAEEAQKLLRRFQNTIQLIVEFAKNVDKGTRWNCGKWSLCPEANADIAHDTQEVRSPAEATDFGQIITRCQGIASTVAPYPKNFRSNMKGELNRFVRRGEGNPEPLIYENST